MRKVIQNVTFEKSESDCRMQNLKNLLAYYNINLSVESIFGLGEGIDFKLVEHSIKGIPCMSIVGRNLEIEKVFSQNSGIDIIENRSEISNDQLDTKMKNELNLDNPILVNMDRYFLEFLNIKKAHFGLHNIVLIGYDDIKNTVLINDSLAKKTEEIDTSVFNLARLSKLELYPPSGIWMQLKAFEEPEILQYTHLKSIISNCKNIIYNNDDGINGIKKIISKLRVINKIQVSDKKVQEAYINFQLNYLSKLILEEEATRTLYRKIYGEYLIEISKKFKDKVFEKLGKDMIEISVIWHKMARSILSFKDYKTKLDISIKYFEKILIRETDFFEKLLIYSEKKIKVV